MSTPGTRCWARSHLIALGHYIRPPRRQLCSDSTLSEVARPATGGPGLGNFLKRGDCGDDSFGVGRPRLRILRGRTSDDSLGLYEITGAGPVRTRVASIATS